MRIARVVVLCLLSATALRATTFIVAPDEQLFEKSEAVVIASVIGSRAAFSEGIIMTATDIRIEAVIKGTVTPGSIVTTEAPGGTVGTTVMEIHGVPHFEAGEKVMLFLTQWKPGRWGTTDLAVGKFDFKTDVKGRRVLVREENEISGWDSDLSSYTPRHRSAEGFERYLRRLARGARPAPDYVLDSAAIIDATDADKPSGRLSVGSDAVVLPANNYLMLQGGTNFRWRVWDTSPSTQVPYRSFTMPGQLPVPGASNAVTAATAAWTNESCSVINIVNGGASQLPAPNGSAGAPDSENTVRWEVDIAGVNDFQCSGPSTWGGTLGIGGPKGLSGTHTFDGMTYTGIIEGDVDMNRGLASPGCAALPQAVKDGALAHEIGHTLNFRHSDQNRAGNAACGSPLPCSSVAVMTSSMPDVIKSAGAVLQSWDIDATRAVYPGTCGTPVGTAGKKGDFNRDGRDDIIWRNSVSGDNSFWFLNNTAVVGGGGFNAVADTNWKIGGTGDFNRDGNTDILWHHETTGTNTVWFMNGANYSSQVSVASTGDVNMIPSGVGDFDNDGYVDIVWRNRVNGQNTIWFMTGTNLRTATPTTPVADLTWKLAGAGDTNADGRADLLWWHQASGSVVVWPMNGATAGSTFIGQVADTTWRVAAVGDWNGDGRADIAWENVNNSLAVWLLNGAAVTGGGFVGAVPDLTWDVAGSR